MAPPLGKPLRPQKPSRSLRWHSNRAGVQRPLAFRPALADMQDMQSPLASALLARIQARQAVIGIIGLGYVGLPLAIAIAGAGFKVLGFDIDLRRVAALNEGDGLIKHISNAPIREAIAKGLFEATADFTRLDEPDAILICVPTPLTRQREPDMSYVANSTASIAARLRRGQLVILESSTWPGTTEELMKPVLDAPPSSGTKWKGNLFRIDYDKGQALWSWQLTSGNFHEYEKFGSLRFE